MKLSNSQFIRSILLLLTLVLTDNVFGPTTVTALQLGSRQSPAHILIARAQLEKRGNCCSQPDDPEDPPDYGAPYPSDPSVDDLKTDITSLGTVAGKRSLFYTGLGGLGGQNQVEAWACLAIDPSGASFVVFRTLFPDSYIQKKLVNIANNPGKSYCCHNSYITIIRSSPNSTLTASIDLWGKRASWGWAELAEGDTYIAIPTGVTPADDSTWALYEYPALQRNNKVDHIIRVDPNTAATTTIWTQGTDPTDTPDPGPQHRNGPPV